MLDYPFVHYLLEITIRNNPTDDCHVLGKPEDWEGLPSNKSLFFAAEGCGLPIGNLSSQLFSNVYMNVFDQYVKRTLRCKHYGRYVDDAFIVSTDRMYLKRLIPVVTGFLQSELGLEISTDKTRIYDVKYGVEFLGAYIKPFRTYVSTASLKRIKRRIKSQPTNDLLRFQSSANSYLGVLSHYDSYCMRRVLFGYLSHWAVYGRFTNEWLGFTPCGAKKTV